MPRLLAGSIRPRGAHALGRAGLAVTFALLLWGTTYAQELPIGAVTTRALPKALTGTEIIVLSQSGNTISKAISWGSKVRWVGTGLLAGAIVYGALDWFYQTLQASTGTTLDDWYAGTSVGRVGRIYVRVYDSASSQYDFVHGYATVWNTTGQVANYDQRGNCDTTVQGACGAAIIERLETARTWVMDSTYRDTWGGVIVEWSPTTDLTVAGKVVEETGVAIDRVPLDGFLSNSPEALDAVRNQVIPQYSDSWDGNAVTYADPLPGINYSPTPNINQWYDNPYANTTLDTDMDGWKDWFEDQLGSDPSDPSSVPCSTCDPDGDTYSNDQEHTAGTDPLDPYSNPGNSVDTDSDGLVDSADPCPTDPTNACADGAAEPGTEGELLARIAAATEATHQALEGTATFTSGSEPTLDASALQAYDPTLDPTAFANTASTAGARFQPVLDVAATRFPFALASWVPANPGVVNESCPTFALTFYGASADLGICGTEADAFLVNVGRPVLESILYLSMVLSLVGLAARS